MEASTVKTTEFFGTYFPQNELEDIETNVNAVFAETTSSMLVPGMSSMLGYGGVVEHLFTNTGTDDTFIGDQMFENVWKDYQRGALSKIFDDQTTVGPLLSNKRKRKVKDTTSKKKKKEGKKKKKKKRKKSSVKFKKSIANFEPLPLMQREALSLLPTLSFSHFNGMENSSLFADDKTITRGFKRKMSSKKETSIKKYLNFLKFHVKHTKTLGAYDPESRIERLRTWRLRRQRNFKNFLDPKTKYAVRKSISDSRPRTRGRFAKTSDRISAQTASAPATKNATTVSAAQKKPLGLLGRLAIGPYKARA